MKHKHIASLSRKEREKVRIQAGKLFQNYRGVCRIDYFSGDMLMELKQIAEVIFVGL